MDLYSILRIKMPAKSQQQLKFIYAMRNKYKSKRNAPRSMKWVFNTEWTEGVKMKKLPHKLHEVLKFYDFVNENQPMASFGPTSEVSPRKKGYNFDDFLNDFIHELERRAYKTEQIDKLVDRYYGDLIDLFKDKKTANYAVDFLIG